MHRGGCRNQQVIRRKALGRIKNQEGDGEMHREGWRGQRRGMEKLTREDQEIN